MQNPAPQGDKVAHWLKGGEWDCLLLRLFPRYCLLHIMVQPALEMEWASLSVGQAGLRSASVPHHNQVLWLDLGLLRLEAWLQEVDTWLEKVIVCVVPKLQGLVFQCKTLLPREKKLPINRDDHWTGEFAVIAHHRGWCIGGCVYQAGIIRTPCTNFTFHLNIPKCTRSCTVWHLLLIYI